MKLRRCFFSCFLLTAAASFPMRADELMLVPHQSLEEQESFLATPEEDPAAILYEKILDAYQGEVWDQLLLLSHQMVKKFPQSPLTKDLPFYQGVAFFHTKNYTGANERLSSFLNDAKPSGIPFFERVIEYKLAIAEQFAQGAKGPLFGIGGMPRWVAQYDEALEIFDEIIAAVPYQEESARALFGKGVLLQKTESYKEAVAVLQTLIRRFPKHPLAIEGYLKIGDVYLMQAQEEFPDLDLLELAQLNCKKFQKDFPREERLAAVDQMLLEMKEIYAANLYEIGRFYERTGKPQASQIYYKKILQDFPETKTAQMASKRLHNLRYQPKQEELSGENNAPELAEGNQ